MASLLNMSGGSLIKSISTQQIVGEDLAGTYGFVDNTYIDRGNEVPWTAWSSTDYVDISKYSRVYADGGGSFAAYYDENKTYISGYRVVKPANAKYIRCSEDSNALHNGHIIGLF